MANSKVIRTMWRSDIHRIYFFCDRSNAVWKHIATASLSSLVIESWYHHPNQTCFHTITSAFAKRHTIYASTGNEVDSRHFSHLKEAPSALSSLFAFFSACRESLLASFKLAKAFHLFQDMLKKFFPSYHVEMSANLGVFTGKAVNLVLWKTTP